VIQCAAIAGRTPHHSVGPRPCGAGGETFAASAGHVAGFCLQASSSRRSRARSPFPEEAPVSACYSPSALSCYKFGFVTELSLSSHVLEGSGARKSRSWNAEPEDGLAVVQVQFRGSPARRHPLRAKFPHPSFKVLPPHQKSRPGVTKRQLQRRFSAVSLH
jgi:hypothetical protein